MGRESRVAFIPTSSIPGGSCAPIENSPPGIHAMPSGATKDGGCGLGIVSAKLPTESAGADALTLAPELVERCRRSEAMSGTATSTTSAPLTRTRPLRRGGFWLLGRLLLLTRVSRRARVVPRGAQRLVRHSRAENRQYGHDDWKAAVGIL